VRAKGENGSRILVAAAVGASLLALVALGSTSAESRPTAPRAATVSLVTTHDFRVAVLTKRLTGGSAPTAEVRVDLARRVGAGWRELGERRLGETFFWHTISGPRAVCRLSIATTGARPSFQPYVTLQLPLSPSLGCGRTYRIPLSA
jgi:hypothetical protein